MFASILCIFPQSHQYVSSSGCTSLITLYHRIPGFYVCAVQVFLKHGEKEKLSVTSNFSFSHCVLCPFGELSIIFIKFKLSSANSFSLEESKIFCLWKDWRFTTQSQCLKAHRKKGFPCLTIYLPYEGKFQSFNPFPNNKFWTLPNSKSLQMTISNLIQMAERFPNG